MKKLYRRHCVGASTDRRTHEMSRSFHFDKHYTNSFEVELWKAVTWQISYKLLGNLQDLMEKRIETSISRMD